MGFNNRFSNKANLSLYIITTALIITSGSLHIYNSSLDQWGMILGILMILLALINFGYGYLTLSAWWKYSPKVKVKDTFIELKNRLFIDPIRIDWSDIVSIELGLCFLRFQTNDKMVNFTYQTSAETSIQIKNLLMEVASGKGIEVKVG